jgi:energy-coupling factor transporter transmembrane protein EcfT
MVVITAPMNANPLSNLLRLVSVICAVMLFLAVLDLPSGYYRLLRIVVFAGALIVVLKNLGNNHWRVVVFALVAILFNPFYPIYLYHKMKWIPIDIVTGALFLLDAFYRRKPDQDLIQKDKTRR